MTPLKLNKIRSAKQLTFIYFAGLACAIIAFHFSLFNSTLKDLEIFNAKNRLAKERQLAEPFIKQGKTLFDISPYTQVFVGTENLPTSLPAPSVLAMNQLHEIEDGNSEYYDFFIMKSQLMIKGKAQDYYLLHYDEVYETSEQQMYQQQYKQMLIALLLLAISLYLILRVSDRLTAPLSKLSNQLKQRSVNHFEPLALPDKNATKEIHQLTQRINEYQEKIQNLIEKERSFTRYASHELRSPLMVMRGVISLLGHADSPEFVERQRLRLKASTDEMDHFVNTLLSLTRNEKQDSSHFIMIQESLLQKIIASQQHLLEDKPVECKIQWLAPCKIKVPDNLLPIILGNMLKNAFSNTFEGSVTLQVSEDSISIIDTGIGLKESSDKTEGFGLGLLIVKDICQLYDWHFELTDNAGKGCCAKVCFALKQSPS